MNPRPRTHPGYAKPRGCSAPLAGTRLHTRTIIRGGRQAFVGSQSLRTAELDLRRELGLIVQDTKAVREAVTRAGEDVLHDKDVKGTMKKVLKKAVKEAVKEAVQDAQDVKGAKSLP